MNSRSRNYVWWGILIVIPISGVILLLYIFKNELAGLYVAEAVGGSMGIWLAFGRHLLNFIFGKEEYECDKCKLRFTSLEEAEKHEKICKK